MSGWYVMSELPEPRSFDAASQPVTEDNIIAQVPVGWPTPNSLREA
jgi:hypothetical protein